MLQDCAWIMVQLIWYIVNLPCCCNSNMESSWHSSTQIGCLEPTGCYCSYLCGLFKQHRADPAVIRPLTPLSNSPYYCCFLPLKEMCFSICISFTLHLKMFFPSCVTHTWCAKSERLCCISSFKHGVWNHSVKCWGGEQWFSSASVSYMKSWCVTACLSSSNRNSCHSFGTKIFPAWLN